MEKIKAELGWNTGRMYARDGQQISAHRHEDKILFQDHSRCIYGELTVDCDFTPSAIQAAYDNGKYRWNGTASWIDAGEFPMRRM